MIKNTVSQLLETEMDRKDFLKLLGLGVIAATGVTQILKAVTPQNTSRRPATSSNASLGYGASAYGGVSSKK